MPQADINNKIKNILESALRQYLVKDYDEAIRSLKSAEVLDKNNPEIIYNLAISYCKLGLYNTAIEYFEKLLHLPVTWVDILTVKKLLSFALLNINKYAEADSYLNEIIKTAPSDISAHSLKGYSLEKQNRFNEAEIVFRAIIDLDHDNNNACNSLAYILAAQNGNINEALKYAKKAIKADNRNPAYLDTLGYVYMKKGNPIYAEKCLKIAIKKAPFSKEIKQHLQELSQQHPLK